MIIMIGDSMNVAVYKFRLNYLILFNNVMEYMDSVKRLHDVWIRPLLIYYFNKCLLLPVNDHGWLWL